MISEWFRNQFQMLVERGIIPEGSVEALAVFSLILMSLSVVFGFILPMLRLSFRGLRVLGIKTGELFQRKPLSQLTQVLLREMWDPRWESHLTIGTSIVLPGKLRIDVGPGSLAICRWDQEKITTGGWTGVSLRELPRKEKRLLYKEAQKLMKRTEEKEAYLEARKTISYLNSSSSVSEEPSKETSNKETKEASLLDQLSEGDQVRISQEYNITNEKGVCLGRKTPEPTTGICISRETIGSRWPCWLVRLDHSSDYVCVYEEGLKTGTVVPVQEDPAPEKKDPTTEEYLGKKVVVRGSIRVQDSVGFRDGKKGFRGHVHWGNPTDGWVIYFPGVGTAHVPTRAFSDGTLEI